MKGPALHTVTRQNFNDGQAVFLAFAAQAHKYEQNQYRKGGYPLF